MHTGRTVFAQLMDLVPRRAFERCGHRYGGNARVRSFSCYDQYLCMAFAQLTYRESLRDIETCLRALRPTLYHTGLRGRVARSTLADANETRDWRLYADFAQALIRRARALYLHEPFEVELAQTASAFDATTIDLCLALFPWIKQHLRIKAFYGTSEHAVKTQVWIAVSVYVLVAILKQELKLERSLYGILQILSLTLFEIVPIHQALSLSFVPDELDHSRNQLSLFDL